MTETQVQRLSGKKIKITYKQHTKWGIRDKTLEGIVTPSETKAYSTRLCKTKATTHWDMYINEGERMILIEWNELKRVKILSIL